MEHNEVADRVLKVFREVMPQAGTVNEHTVRNDIVEIWDSLSHVQLMAELQQEFGITFKAAEILEVRSMADLISLIEGKL